MYRFQLWTREMQTDRRTDGELEGQQLCFMPSLWWLGITINDAQLTVVYSGLGGWGYMYIGFGGLKSLAGSKGTVPVVNSIYHDIDKLSYKHYSQELIRRWDSERELFYDDIVHVEASAYAHWTDFLISPTTIYARPNQSSMHLRPSHRVITLFCPNNRWIIAQIFLIWP